MTIYRPNRNIRLIWVRENPFRSRSTAAIGPNSVGLFNFVNFGDGGSGMTVDRLKVHGIRSGTELNQ